MDIPTIEDEEYHRNIAQQEMPFEEEIWSEIFKERAIKMWLTDIEVVEIINKIYNANNIPPVGIKQALHITARNCSHVCGHDLSWDESNNGYCFECGGDFSHWFLIYRGILSSNERTEYWLFQITTPEDDEKVYQEWREKCFGNRKKDSQDEAKETGLSLSELRTIDLI